MAGGVDEEAIGESHRVEQEGASDSEFPYEHHPEALYRRPTAPMLSTNPRYEPAG